MNRMMPCIFLLATAGGFAMAPPAGAVTSTRYQVQTGANMCTLSVPTTDTKVRPRATGYNNEGATSAFVICSFDPPPGAQYGVATEFKDAYLYLVSLDGMVRDVTCTGVNSIKTSGLVPQFVPKTLSVSSTTTETAFAWLPADFDGTSTIPYSGGAFSVTCILPPQTSIEFGGAHSDEYVGS
ncbi:hypothetical protein FNZ56_12540 [Pseudoluteimonas lycopersici]|uniref:Spore coat protein U domain-containing protein n=1 Tax=Pseudoluteimonas lycopersici TaxID=1324796 RepID=A0A516V7Z6_9GAMM|nr:hypothetical protein [Lysobacter lycopersici]QDQ74653.1 hypothetical protein FNZ56_12540 [Lysobacter lycopersici]